VPPGTSVFTYPKDGGQQYLLQGAGHVMGTYRMGSDPDTSVVDATLRSHDHQNLYLLGSGVFPSVGTANPTLTIAALTLMAAEAILKNL
jgi:choline dehydrogenase-like flavoprotein